MKSLIHCVLIGLITLPAPLFAQKQIRELDLINMKTLIIAQWQECEDLFLISDVDMKAIEKYSSISVDTYAYEKKFGESTMREYSSDQKVLQANENNMYLGNGSIGFDSVTGALITGAQDSYLVSFGKTGITFDENGERNGKGAAEYDERGRIVDWSWAQQRRSISYSPNGLMQSLIFNGEEFVFSWDNGLLTEISVRSTYGDKSEDSHYWAEVVERNSDGYWTTLDLFKRNRGGEKVKLYRYIRKFE